MKSLKTIIQKGLFGVFTFVILATSPLAAQNLSTRERLEIGKALSREIDREVMGGATKIQKVEIRGRRLRIHCSAGLANYPFRPERVEALIDTVRSYLPEKLKKHQIELYTEGHNIEELIPLACRTTKGRKGVIPFTNPSEKPLIRPLDARSNPKAGLQGRHIALWQSHGLYFEQEENRWQWQRTVHWQTREDLFTQSFVLPYLIPMLEQAGACVLLPRERDLSPQEWITDNDPSYYTTGRYVETNGRERWQEGGPGFAWQRATLQGDENPFREGSCRQCRTTHKGAESEARWEVEISEAGRYMLYVSYRTLPESCDEAHYRVEHAGGVSHFVVNQQMGGGTWIPVGEFDFEQGVATVTLSNHSSKSGQIVTADAVRIGGGYGNVARTVCDSLRREGVSYTPQLSGVTRSMEGARYWLQWAGFSPSVYAPKGGTDDYAEDYMSRAHWVNTLMGGSERLPDQEGLAIPIDLALAFHTDSGVRDSDETIGTLGIFFTRENEGLFEGGASRYRSRDLTDLVMSEIVEDIRASWEPQWRRRALWDRSYYEARVPAAPTMLLELLSHQNLADMRYGHDPRFKFLVARAIYKGILKHLAAQYDQSYVVQPLPVTEFSIEREGDRRVHLKWQPRLDEREPTAAPTAYILYTALDEGAFDRGVVINDSHQTLEIDPGHHYHFRLTAINGGGESFPSETLSAYIAPEERGEVLIINGFTRVSAPLSFRGESEAGFSMEYDSGVAYGNDIAYIGRQYNFDRSTLREENPAKALGASSTEWEGRKIGGNTFDYPALHGRSIARAGYSYTSASLAAAEAGKIPTDHLTAVDLILGKQRSTLMGSGSSGYDFKSFSDPLQEFIRNFTSDGISIFVSGSYVASDLWESDSSTDRDRHFAREVLHYEYQQEAATRAGQLRGISPELPLGGGSFRQQLSEEHYAVESPDALQAADEEGFPCLIYPENGLAAGIAARGEGYRTVVWGVPFESIEKESDRHRMMQRILQFLDPK